MHDDMVFSFIFQMKNGCFRSAVALVAIVLCLEIVQGNENSLADQVGKVYELRNFPFLNYSM